jgi:hypothetical protein
MKALSANGMRAEAAQRALEAYSLAKRICSDEPELSPLELLTDLVADLLHWSDAANLDFHAALRLAEMHHGEEQFEESC